MLILFFIKLHIYLQLSNQTYSECDLSLGILKTETCRQFLRYLERCQTNSEILLESSIVDHIHKMAVCLRKSVFGIKRYLVIFQLNNCLL